SLMDFGGLSMNMISLMGITLGIGMFVDNSIVVLESAYRKQLAGHSPADAAREGTAEVAKPIIASTLTTVAVFVPMLFVEGMAGLIFDDLSMTISFALIVSLGVALTLVPLLCAKFLKIDPESVSHIDRSGADYDLSLADVAVHSGNKAIDGITGLIQRMLLRLDDRYEKIVSWAINHGVTVIVSAVVLLALSVGSVLLLGMEFLPESDEGEFSIYMETRTGASFQSTTSKVIEVENLIIETFGDNLSHISSQVGRGGNMIDAGNVGSHLATVHVMLLNKDERDASIWELMRNLDEEMGKKLLDIKYTMNVEGIASLASSATGESDPVAVELRGDDLDELYVYAKRIEAVFKTVDGTRNEKVSHNTGKPELQFRIKRREALSLGLSPFEIAATVRAAYKGYTVTRYTEEEESYDVVLLLREEDRVPERFSSLYFVNQAGTRIPLENLVDIEEGTGPMSVSRKGRTRVITVTAGLTGERALNRVMADVRAGIDAAGPPPLGIDMAYAGTSEEMNSSYESLFLALLFAVALVYMVMASQFESLLHPFIVMFSVPFAIIGLVVALLITNTTFSLLAFVGAILLVGIVVNNAIVLIDYINLLRSRGVPLREAIVKGGKTRLKPILMTSLTTIFGLLPMSLGIGQGSELRAPMGRAIVGGLTTSTMVTLVLIPVLYWIVESRLRRKKNENQHAQVLR
ncbi:MAG: efflux RND transporter permease subunit, partial [Spirochaetales bacterium]|nr:efflux RND transporter permease subunit [Spirochaetales bacterium]